MERGPRLFGRPRPDLRASLDNLLTHPVSYVSLLVVLVGLFWGVFGLGRWMEGGLRMGLEAAFQPVSVRLGQPCVGAGAQRGGGRR